jgi:hypothetical protein
VHDQPLRHDRNVTAARNRAALLPLQWVRVLGPSMVPTLHTGDLVLVRHGARIRSGDVVLASFASMPDRPVIKRATSPAADGWTITSDNPFAGGDSSVHGPARVHARALFALHRGDNGHWSRARLRPHGVRHR